MTTMSPERLLEYAEAIRHAANDVTQPDVNRAVSASHETTNLERAQRERRARLERIAADLPAGCGTDQLAGAAGFGVPGDEA